MTLLIVIGCSKKESSPFKLIEKKQIKSLNAVSYTYEHLKTGAKVIYIDDGGTEKSFGITFKTPTVDDTGVNHVFEHAVLQGSEKYPDKNLFYKMKSKNISSFLTATTEADYTLYAFSAIEENSFNNILDIFLSGVFTPIVLNNENLLKREGWRYDRTPNNGKLVINGIVYNEMKGLFSDPTANILFKLNRLMYPDKNANYRFVAGGDPSKISDLNLEQLRKTHENYYTPSNSIAVISGKVKIDEKLEKLDEYYSKFKKTEVAEITLQKTKLKDKLYKEEYPAPEGAEDIYVYGTLMDPKTSISELSFVNALLGGYETSPLQRMFKEHRFSGSLDSFIDEYEQPRDVILISGIKEKEIHEIRKSIDKEMDKILKEGIDPKLINLAFENLKKQNLQVRYSKNRPEDLAGKAAKGYFYYGKPDFFISDDSLKQIEILVKNPEKIKSLIKKFYTNNNNKIEVLFRPNSHLLDQAAEKESQKLKNFEAGLNEEGKNKLNNDIQNFNRWVKTPVEKKIVDSIPKTEVKDLINSEIPIVERDEQVIDDVKFIKNEINTYGLNLVSLKFDTSGFTRDEKMELELFSNLITVGSTPDYTYENLSDSLSKYFFKFNFKNGAVVSKDGVLRQFSLDYGYLPENREKVYSILEEVLLMGSFDKKLLIKKKLERIRESILNNSSDSEVISKISMIKSRSMVNPDYAYFLDSDLNHYIKSLGVGETNFYVYPPMIKKINNILADFDNNFPKLQDDMKRIRQKVFNKNNLTVFYAETSDNLKDDIKPLLDKLTNTPIKKVDYAVRENSRLAIEVPAQNGASSWGNNLLEMGYEYSGKYKVMAGMINEYLTKKIRVENGAYGAFFVVTPNHDLFSLSFRDGEVDRTIEAYKSIPDYLKTRKNISQEKLDGYILQGLAKYYKSYTPDELLSLSYNYYINNIDMEVLEKEKSEILSVTKDDIEIFIETMEKFTEDKYYSTVNNSTLIKEKGKNVKYDRVIKFEDIK